MIKKSRLFYIIGGVALLLAISAIQAGAAVDVGTNEINSAIQLGSESPLRIAARIINIFMIFLGTIAVGLILFAGFKWMTSGGNEEQIAIAKKTLRNALIGLAIILSAWGIVTFIFSRLLGTTGGTGNELNNGGKNGGALGFGAIGSCVIDSVYPEIDQKDVARNTSIIVTFKESLDLSSVCVDDNGGECICNTNTCNKPNSERIKVYPTDAGAENSVTDLKVMTPNDMTLVFVPTTPLGSASANTWYTVSLTNDLRKADGRQLFDTCSTDYFRWQFEVNSLLDLTPPQVRSGGIFPAPDNNRDQAATSSNWAFASGSIRVKQQPQVYAPASIVSVAKNGGGSYQNATAVADAGYQGQNTIFTVTLVGQGGATRAQLYSGGSSLGLADFSGKTVNFAGYFSLTLASEDDRDPGNSWTVTVSPEKTADTITISGDVYTFVNASSSVNIQSISGLPQQASRIQDILSGRNDVEPTITDASPTRVNLRAKAAGESGNSIEVLTNNNQTFEVIPLSGGANQQVTFTVNDKPDKPMNSVIQINFNEALNPIAVSGTADQLKDGLRVVNARAGSLANGATCNSDNACLSFKCESNKCVGDYLDGKFSIANGYKTVEFKSNRECGMNGCGEKIYCLPASSQIKVEIMAADLKTCSTDTDCVAPYSTCANNASLGHKTCQDNNGHNYSIAASPTTSGIMDAAMNSLDGNRDTYADGPIVVGGLRYFYDENAGNAAYKDNYRWSFYINNQVATDPPKITDITPAVNGNSNNLVDPVVVDFNSLLMNSSLRSGSETIKIGTSTVDHHFFNLFTKTGPAPGYWITGDNIDNSPQDGEMDYTKVRLNHVMLAEAVDYNSQAGSAVRDIYQNCFKPSASATCLATQINPSCCNGTPGAILDEDGNCAQ
ncbi:MAG TPA: hypothetical protein PKI61_00735 [bacterium]|nr:hypothetical protein [bacterium]HPT29410.1 hypothetical protein [bacterium]